MTDRRHLVIAGTGRAGTTFLVRWLAAAGLDVGNFDPDAYHDTARCGLERRLTDDPTLPYVVKDPWLWTYCRDVDPAIIDTLIVPVRRLTDAANSRIRVEREAIGDTVRATWGTTHGGVLWSLDETDQARILAVGFYELVQWAVENRVPLLFLDYPRIVHDAEYLTTAMAPFVSPYSGAAAHAEIAAP